MSIGNKMILWITAVIVVLGIASAYLFYRFELADGRKQVESLGSTVGRILEKSLSEYMLKRDPGGIDKTLSSLVTIKPISGIYLTDRKGIVRSSDAGRNDGVALPIDIVGKGRGSFLDQQDVYRWIQPVQNKRECWQCHSRTVEYNGAFVIDLSLADSREQVKKGIGRGIAVFVPALILIGLVIILLSRILITKRQSTLLRDMTRFKDGEYSVRTSVRGRDELGGLGRCFNEMALSIECSQSENRRLLDDVNRKNHEWQATFDAITDLVSIHDNNFTVIKANKAFIEHVGVEGNTLPGKKCYEVLHHTRSPLNSCPLAETIKTATSQVEEVVDPRTKRTFSISTFPYHASTGEIVGIVHIAKDITDRKEQEQLFAMNERFAGLGRMASGVAHEINNPLAAISGCAEGLLGRVERNAFDQELFGRYLGIIREEIARCKSITTSMLSFTRNAVYEKSFLDIREVMRKSIELFGFQGRLKNVTVLTNFPDNLSMIYGSEGELRQVIMAVLSNALDAMSDQGTIMLSVREENGRMILTVGDSGIGIRKEHVDRIFEPFFTTRTDRGCAGLGLSIAKKIVQNHSGTITVASEEEKGTTVHISFPAGERTASVLLSGCTV